MPFGGYALDSVFFDFHHFPYDIDYPRPLFGTQAPSTSRPPARRRRRRPCTRDDDDFAALVHGTMAHAEPSLFVPLSDDDDDDLVEIVSARPSRPAAAAQAPLALPQPAARSRRRHAGTPVPLQDDSVIDLTEEPDSPVEVRPPQRSNTTTSQASGAPPVRLPPMRLHRHPRRTNSQRATPPRLSRSESIMLGSEPSFIDLTGDDDTTSTTNNRANNHNNEPSRRSHRNHQPPIIFPHHHQHHNAAGPGVGGSNGIDHLVDLEFLGPRHSFGYDFATTLARGFGRTLADMFTSDVLTGATALTGAGFPGRLYTQRGAPRPPREATPPRAMQPLPPTRPGFTRETLAADEEGSSPNEDSAGERVVVCPACDKELAYDPTEGVVHTTATGAKKRKRAPGDHHFWAVKNCGHVYCSDCFENRRPLKTGHDGAGFRDSSGKSSRYNTPPQDLRCAVEGCDSKVANKTEWVGIFL